MYYKKMNDWSNYEMSIIKMICHCYQVNDKKRECKMKALL